MKSEMNLNQDHKKRLHQIALLATFGGLLFGYDTGVVNGALRPLREDFGLTAFTEGLVMSTLLLGAALGGLAGGRCTDLYGRRKYLLVLSVVFIFGALLSACAPNLEVLLVSRFILGFAVGGASVSAPTYLSEISPAEVRGKLTGLNEVIVVGGQFLAFVVNAFIGLKWGEVDGIWRYMLAMQTLPAIGLFFGMLFTPESPRWLISQGRHKEALAILMKIRPEERAIREFKEIQAIKNHKDESVGFSQILRVRWIRNLVLVGAVWAGLQQTTGINVIMYYGTEILVSAGFSERMALLANMLNGLTALAGITIGVLLLADKYRRKTYSMVAFFIMAALLLVIALVDSTVHSGIKPLLVWILCSAFVGVMCGSVGFLTWVVLAELFPLKIRGAAMGVCVFFMWVTNAGVSYAFPLLKDAFGLGAVFYILAGINLFGGLFVKGFLPETKDKSLEALEEELAHGETSTAELARQPL